jgi:hypothetical protein
VGRIASLKVWRPLQFDAVERLFRQPDGFATATFPPPGV